MRAVTAGPKWERFAASEPYFAVLAHEQYLSRNLDEAARRRFFESGEEHVTHLFDTIHREIAPRFAPEHILEFGCGPGRLAIPFARRVKKVTAVDASPAMLERAREHARTAGVRNIEFLSLEEFSQSGDRFDFINCYLVFQHIPKRRGLHLLRSLTERLTAGGIGVFELPVGQRATGAVRTLRTLRAQAPLVNGIANLARRKPFSFPFFESHVYDRDEIVNTLTDVKHTHRAHQGDLDVETFYVQRPGGGAEAEERIEVRELIANTSIEELNRKAEEYFSSLTEWSGLLAKPFTNAADTPAMLVNFATVLQGMRLAPGLTVLDFGAGTGWLSRILTQLGCRVILLDVSPTALRIARELYERLPVIGTKPQPEFLVYDGHRIDLPDASVDRIVCFDAFHHSPNPDEVLAEFARILKPGGIAAFAEPGPEHSKTAQSQFEMRTYGVVENDVDIQAIWATARRVGFSDLKLAGWSARPFHVRLDEYEDLLRGGETLGRWANWTREFMVNVRDFFLYREGEERLDSRHVDALSCSIEVTVSTPARAGAPIEAEARLANTGTGTWLRGGEPLGGVNLGSHLYDANGTLLSFEHYWEPVPRSVAPGESFALSFRLPPLETGTYEIEFDCVAREVSWFAPRGSKPARVRIEVQ